MRTIIAYAALAAVPVTALGAGPTIQPDIPDFSACSMSQASLPLLGAGGGRKPTAPCPHALVVLG